MSEDRRKQDLAAASLEYHERAPRGKVRVMPTKPHATQRDLTLAYSPGVAYPCLEIDKDPEDVRYNFVRWLNNDVGTAIGPSRVNPTTGQILDADIILTDGWIRHFRYEFDNLLPKMMMEGFSAETMSWLASNPQWDPRLALLMLPSANMCVRN